MSKDPVNHPQHYNTDGDIECIDSIRAMLGPEGFAAYCQGSAHKYIWRHEHKDNPVQDLEKAIWYLKRLIEERAVEEVGATYINPTMTWNKSNEE